LEEEEEEKNGEGEEQAGTGRGWSRLPAGGTRVPLTTSVPAGMFLYADRRGQEETPSPLATWVRIAHVDGLGQ